MPRKTFFNLSEEKQNRIMEAAITEFAKKGYQKGSVQSIANKAGVSKGSMYQYFENKEELFYYIFELSFEMKMKYITKIMESYEEDDFFNLLKHLFLDTIDYAREKPELYQIYHNLLNGESGKILDEVEGKITKEGQKYYRSLIIKAQKEGEIRDDINLDLITFIIYILFKDLGQLVGEKLFKVSKKELEKEIDSLLEIIKNGLKPRGGYQID